MTAIEVAHAFVEAINRRSPDELSAWMTDDHTFVDSLGNRVEGKEKMKPAWAGYFRMVPDYSITVDETFASGETVVMLGTAQGAYSAKGELRPGNHWKTPAAWRVQVRGAVVAEWRVYADNEPLRKLMAQNG
jgi:ketosteroid isomerase-like protein